MRRWLDETDKQNQPANAHYRSSRDTTAAVTTAAVSANTAAATSNAYNVGYTAGATQQSSAATTTTTGAPATATITYSVGQIVPKLPAGCITPTVQGTTYYLCGNTWFKAAYGANGVYYRVVPSP